MLLIRARIPDLPAFESDFQVETIGLRGYNACFLQSKRKDQIKSESSDLFGHLLDANYVPPPNDGWLDAGAQPQVQAQPQQQQPQPAAEPQELIEDVLHQAAQLGQQIVPELAAEVLHEVLVQNDDAHDPVLVAIEEFKEQETVQPEVDRPGSSLPKVVSSKDNIVDLSLGRDGDTASDDDEATPNPPPHFPHPSIKGKRKADDTDPAFRLVDEPSDSDDDQHLRTQKRQHIRSFTSSLTIGDVPQATLTAEMTEDVQLTEPVSRPLEKEIVRELVRPETHPTTKSARAAADLIRDVATAAAKAFSPPFPSQPPPEGSTELASKFAAGLLAEALSQPSLPQTYATHVASLTPPGPTTITVTPVTDAERITSLESKVRELEKLTSSIPKLLAENLSLAQQLVDQSTAYASLMKSHSTLLDDFTLQRLKLENLERLVLRVRSGRPAQGEIEIYIESCKQAAALDRARRDDQDDDPNTQRDSEQARPLQTSQQANIQGESTDAGASGSAVGGSGDGAGTSVAGTSEAGKIA